MNKEFKRYFIIITGIIIVSLLTIMIFNFINDEFCVFKKIKQEDINKKVFWPNERMLKTKYILQNKDKYDSFLFGSSKANMMSLRNIKTGKWYNSCLAMGTLDEIFILLKIYKANGVKIKNVLLQLSNENFREKPTDYFESFNENMIYAQYPEHLFQKLYCYTWYLLVKPDFSKNKRDIYTQNCKDNVLIDGSCTISPPAQSPDTGLNNEGNFKNFPNVDELEKYNDYWQIPLKKIIKFCSENNIKLTVFYTPETYELYCSFDITEVNKQKENLAKLTSYYDFSGKNEITQNKKYFYDYSHHNAYTSNLIIDRIFNELPQNSPKIKGFGEFIKQKI